MRSTSSTNRGTRSRLARSSAWVCGSSAMRRRAVAISRTVVSCPAANRLDAILATSIGSGTLPSGNSAWAMPVSTSLSGCSRRSAIFSEK